MGDQLLMITTKGTPISILKTSLALNNLLGTITTVCRTLFFFLVETLIILNIQQIIMFLLATTLCEDEITPIMVAMLENLSIPITVPQHILKAN